MTLARLISDFSVIDTLPVEIDSVVHTMRADYAVQDEIYYFWDQTLDPRSIRGYLLREEIPRADTTYMRSTITYAKMGNEMERLVCAKELTHIFDLPEAKASTKNDVATLISKIALPAELVDPFNDGHHANSDRVGLAMALALLFPLAARSTLIDAYQDGRLSVTMIAELAELPPYYVSWVLSAEWPEIHRIISA